MVHDQRDGELCSEMKPLFSHADTVALFTGSRSRPWDGVGPKALEVVHIWGEALLAVRHASAGSIVLGSQPGAMLVPPEELPGDNFALFTFEGDAVFCTFSELWDGSVMDESSQIPLRELGPRGHSAGLGLRRMELRAKECVQVRIGGSSFVARLVSPGARISGVRPPIDKPLLGIGGLSAFLGAMITILALTQSPPPRAETNLDERYRIELLLKNIEEPPPVEAPKVKEAGGEKAKREEGRTGERLAKMKEARGEKRKQQVDQEIADNAGVLGALSDNAALADTLGGANGAIMSGVGGLIGARGTQVGVGLGERGGGLGGGGHTDGLSDGDGPGTKGRRSGYGEDAGPQPPKQDGVIPGNDVMVFSNAIDRAQIDAVIRRNIARFRYCYQRQLTRHPDMSGKVVVKFSIARDGSVGLAETKASSLGNVETEECMNTVMRSLTFPEPRGGGVVIVSYPFLFAPG